MKLSMVSIHVTDPAAAHAFYTETLGFESALVMPEYNLYLVRGTGQPAPTLLLEPSDNPIASTYMNALRPEGHAAMVFGTDDLDAEMARLRELGVEFRGKIAEDPSGRSIVFDDTVGNWVQLHEAAGGGPEVDGDADGLG